MNITSKKAKYHLIYSLVVVLILFLISIASFWHHPEPTDMQSRATSGPNHNLEGLEAASELTGSRAPEDVKYWATFQFDFFNTGNTSSYAPKTNNTLWKFNDNGDLKGEIYSSPVVVNDIVYFTATDKYLYAVDLQTGEKIWKYNLLQQSYATPTVFNGYLYVGSGTENDNNNNYLFCLNAETGVLAWSEKLDGPLVGAPVVLDRPGVVEDRIFFGTLKDNKIYCYNFGTKEMLWVQPIPDGGTGGSEGIWSSLAYFNTDELNEIERGRIIFSVNSESANTSISRGLYYFNAEKGTQLWEFRPNVGTKIIQTYASPTVFWDNKDSRVKILIGMGIIDTPNIGKLYCVENETGAELWNFTTGGGVHGYGVTTSPVVAYDKIFFGACDGKFYALDFDGNHLWDFQTADTFEGIYSSAAVANGMVFFGSTDSNFYCLDANNGSLIWKYNMSNEGFGGIYGVSSSPAIAYGRVLVGGCNGYLYCFGGQGEDPPTIEIRKPKENAMVDGLIEISGVADDDIGVTVVQVKIDEFSWRNASGTTLWVSDWDVTSLQDGPHTIYARAFDENGFSMTNVTVLVNNQLEDIFITITSHEDHQIVSGITKFEGVAQHRFGTIEEVQINIDNNTIWFKVNGTNNWHYYWNTKEYLDGEYLIQFKALDGVNTSIPISIWVNVSNYIEPLMGLTPMFRNSQNRIGITDFQAPDFESVKVLWKFQTENQIESSAVYYNGKIYFGSDDYYVYCVDSTSGTEIWKYSVPNQVRSTPTIADQRLYIGDQYWNIYCLNAQSGELIWKYRAGGAIDSSPLVVGSSVYFGSYDGKLYSLNASNGQEQWIFDTGNEIWGSPAYWDNCIYIGSLDGRLYCVWSKNGTERWNFTTNLLAERYGIYSTPAITQNRVIFGGEDNLIYCLNASTSELLWKFKTTGYIYSSAAINKNRVFISSLEANNDGVLYALPFNDPNLDGLITSSEVLWKYKTHDFDGGSSPTISTKSGLVIIGSNAGSAGGIGKVYCFDEVSGDVVWNFTINGDIHGTPIIAFERVYIGSLDNYMYCLVSNKTDANGGNGHDPVNKTPIKVHVNLPQTTVLSGHIIENIMFTALTENGTPIPQTYFIFEVTRGTLSDYYGTVFNNGTYILSYTADIVKKNVTVTIKATATKFGYLNGTAEVTIIVVPISTDNGNGQQDDDDSLINEILKPKYLYLWLSILIFVIMNIIIIGLVLRTMRKLKRFERSGSDKADLEKTGRVASGPETTAIDNKVVTDTITQITKPAVSIESLKKPPQAQVQAKAQTPQAQDPTAIPPENKQQQQQLQLLEKK